MNTRLFSRTLLVLGSVLVLSAAGARPILSAPALYDMTGHWVGTAVRPGHGSAGVDLQIVAGPGSAFQGKGLLTTPEENGASIQGSITRGGKFSAVLDSPNQAHIKLKGKIHVNTNTVTGSFKGKNQQHKTIQGTFSITKQP